MTCAKQKVVCTLVTTDGDHVVGENWCEHPQAVCPRAPGEDYTKCKTVCGQFGHAEIDALARAGSAARGARAFLEGHTYFCRACQEALFDAGVASLSRGKPA